MNPEGKALFHMPTTYGIPSILSLDALDLKIRNEDIIKIHETSLKVFTEVGVKVKFPEALELFENNGAKVDKDSRIAKISPDMVMEWIQKAPSTILLCGR